MSFSDDVEDYERNQLATDDECPESEPGIYSHERSGDQNVPPDPFLEALATWNLATLAAMKEPASLDLFVDEYMARVRVDTVVWEAEMRERRMTR